MRERKGNEKKAQRDVPHFTNDDRWNTYDRTLRNSSSPCSSNPTSPTCVERVSPKLSLFPEFSGRLLSWRMCKHTEPIQQIKTPFPNGWHWIVNQSKHNMPANKKASKLDQVRPYYPFEWAMVCDISLFCPYVSYVKRSSTYSIPQELQQFCVYSEVYFVVRTLCLNTDTICIVGKVDSCPCPKMHQAWQFSSTEKPKDVDPSMTSEWKILTVLSHTQPTHRYYCRRKLKSLVLLVYIHYIFSERFQVRFLNRTSRGDNSEKPLFLSSNTIFPTLEYSA